MESTEDDDDLKLVKASAGLLSDLETTLQKILWKRPAHSARVHTRVKRLDLDYAIKLIEPFQGEPQLLDARLKFILPPIVDAYIQYIHLRTLRPSGEDLDFEIAVCALLYNLCKVRGYKVVVGFFKNEPRYLEPILTRLERLSEDSDDGPGEWQVSYILLLWLSHLILTPFDLASLSDSERKNSQLKDIPVLTEGLPSIGERILLVALRYLSASTKAQDAAAALLVRFVGRPDMVELRVADAMVAKAVLALQDETSDEPVTIYQKIGPLRFLAGVCTVAEVGHLVPSIYRTCEQLVEDETSPVMSNAVAKKLVVKIFRNIAIMSLKSSWSQASLIAFFEETSVLEDVIDYLLRSLEDRDTPVRYAAAKALSLIILRLEADMGYEVIQAILDSFDEQASRKTTALDFRAANPLKWHGLTLALAHALFKRSASPDQLPDIIKVLNSALQFEQRTATGSVVGTNVRDAANFGIWSMSRRYTTEELLSVRMTDAQDTEGEQDRQSVVQFMAIQLILSACLDPAGNIRRGSSAALQELIGRHPNQVHEGIALVQIVDYQAVGLRKRAMVDVASQAAELNRAYWKALLDAVFEWRGLGSSDVPSREAAASSLARLNHSRFGENDAVILSTAQRLLHLSANDSEELHGLVLTLAYLVERGVGMPYGFNGPGRSGYTLPFSGNLYKISSLLLDSTKEFSLHLVRSQLPSAIVQLLAAVCRYLPHERADDETTKIGLIDNIEMLTDRLLVRHEDTVLQHIPALVSALLNVKRTYSISLGCIEAQNLRERLIIDAPQSTLSGAGRAIALGTLTPLYRNSLSDEVALECINAFNDITSATNVDWRIIAVRALQLAVESAGDAHSAGPDILEVMVRATHRALNDYTIDERGDVGSLVRLQTMACAARLFAEYRCGDSIELLQTLEADIIRLSLEKLDRVRLSASHCRHAYLGHEVEPTDIASVSSTTYFETSFLPLADDGPAWRHTALLEGAVSCAGISAEPVLQASRAALADILYCLDTERVRNIMTVFAAMLKSMLIQNGNMHPALELFAFLLDMQIPQRLARVDFKWRGLLSTVQKSHHKSSDIPKILAAVHVYYGLSDVSSIRHEVIKKLFSMLKTNPYPRVRLNVAETLFGITKEPMLKTTNWMQAPSQNFGTVDYLEQKFLNEAEVSIP